MLLTVKQKILITLLENGQLKNNDIAKHVGITEQWCSHWQMPIDPLEKACYKWKKANSLSLNSPQFRKVESQNNL